MYDTVPKVQYLSPARKLTPCRPLKESGDATHRRQTPRTGLGLDLLVQLKDSVFHVGIYWARRVVAPYRGVKYVCAG